MPDVQPRPDVQPVPDVQPGPGVPSVPEGDVRVGDVDRRGVDERLQRAVGDGVLTLTEYDERAGEVWAARTRGELAAVVRDLPGPHPVPAAGSPTRRAIAIMGDERLAGPVAPGQVVEGYAVMGRSRLDLSRDDLPAEVRVRAFAVMGEVRVVVPEGAAVHLSGMAVIGDRSVRVAPAVPGGPVVHVTAVSVMGSVRVRSRPAGPERVGGSVVVAAVPVTWAPAPTPPAARQRSAPSVRRRRFRRFGLIAVGAVAVGGLRFGGGPTHSVSTPMVVAIPDSEVPSSSTEFVLPGEARHVVSAGVGDVTVVVPDDMRASVLPSDDVDCEDACATVSDRVVRIVVPAGTGKVEVQTESEHR